jgi:hypothetical protein
VFLGRCAPGLFGRSGTGFFGSAAEKEKTSIGTTYPYAGHLHRQSIRIYLPSAYVTPIQAGLAGIYFTYAGIHGTLSI